MFAGNFAPLGWEFCNGQLLAISEYEALFSLVGTTYGGDGQATFALPDMRGRLPVHRGQGVGLQNYSIGQTGGVENVTLTSIPSHTHAMSGVSGAASSTSPQNRALARTSKNLYRAGTANVSLDPTSVSNTGGGQQHTNLQPYLCVHFIIAIFGIYPSQN